MSESPRLVCFHGVGRVRERRGGRGSGVGTNQGAEPIGQLGVIGQGIQGAWAVLVDYESHLESV